MNITKSKSKYLWSIILFVIIVGVFGFIRATHEYRWGGWAAGDAQNLNAALHFANEGFVKHKFSTYYHPGNLGERFGTETNLGYYTHYPPLNAILNGLIIKFCGENLTILRWVSIIFSLSSLLLFYFLMSRLVDKSVAVLSVVLLGLSSPFLEFMDGLSPYTYSEFYVFGALLMFILADDHFSFRRYFLLTLSWLLIFLESFNSFDYIFFMITFITGYSICINKSKPFPVGKLFIFAMAPVFGFSLHLFQNSIILGGLKNAVTDLVGISNDRIAQLSVSQILNDLNNLRNNMQMYLRLYYGFKWYHLLLLVGVVIYLYRLMKSLNTDDVNKNYYKTALIYTVSVLVWWFVGMKAAYHFAHQMIRQIYPVIALLISYMLLTSWRVINNKSQKIFIKALVIIISIRILYLPLQNTQSYLRDYPNLIHRYRSWALTDYTTEQMIGFMELSKKIRGMTNFGDIVFVPDEFIWLKGGKQPNPLYEFYSQRRMEYVGDNETDFTQRLQKINNYVEHELPQILGQKQGVKIFAIIKRNTNLHHSLELLTKNSKKSINIDDNWNLIEL